MTNGKRTIDLRDLPSWPVIGVPGKYQAIPKRLALLPRLALALHNLPVLRLDPGSGIESGALRRRLTRHSLGLRTALHEAVSVLIIPAAGSGYMAGAAKQTLRRMCRKAEKLGVQCRHVTDASERRALLAHAIVCEQTNPNPLYRRANPDTADLLDIDLWIAAYSRSGTPLVLSVTPIGGNCAALRYFRTLEASNDATLARYLLTAYLVEELRQREMRYLVDVTHPINLNSGLRHFASMVGFTVGRAMLEHRTEKRIRELSSWLKCDPI